MKVVVSRHIFGSVRGYITLAKSEDLSPEQITKLELLSFGQTNESSYMNSLETDPAYISRPLQSGRWAVTRVFQGKPDEHNRTTLLFISAVITTEDWVYVLKCNVDELLDCPSLWQWDSKEKLEPIEVAVEGGREGGDAEIRSRVLCLVAAVEKYSSHKNTTIVVRAADFDVEVLRVLNMVLPLKSKQAFSCAGRSLNDGLPFTLISMAKEGSLGNSKRRTINWTPTSAADDCLYTESLARFWPTGTEPPWQFIDRCRSFSVDLQAAPEGGLSERVVRKKRLAYEVRKAGVRRKRHISWKLGVIVLGCAVLFCLGAAITISATRAKANREEVTSLLKRAQVFLHENSPGNSPNKWFRADDSARKFTIDQCRKLQNEVERLRDVTKDTKLQEGLKKMGNKLANLHNRAQSAAYRYDSLRAQTQRAKSLKKLSVYPSRKEVEDVQSLKDSVANVSKVDLDPTYVSQLTKYIQENTDAWRTNIEKLLYEKQNGAANLLGSDLLQESPPNYSAKTYEDYNDLKQNLDKYKEDESLANAKGSPIEEHSEKAKKLLQQTAKGSERCSEALANMNDLKNKAETAFAEANHILSDPNITDGRFKNFEALAEAYSHLSKVEKRWPGKTDLLEKQKEVTAKFDKNRNGILKRWKDKTAEIEKNRNSGDPNSTLVGDTLKKEEKDYSAKLIELKPYTTGLMDRLRAIKDFDEKLSKEYVALKSKREESKQGK